MNYAYSNNGLSLRAVDADYVAGAGEVLFAGLATSEQLVAAFPNYQAALLPQQAQMAYIAALASGLTVTSTGTPALNGVYGVTQQDQFNLMGLQVAIASGVTIPSSYVDSTGAKRTLNAAQTTAIATVVFAYVAALDQWLATVEGGGTATQPAATATIA